ncbi:serine-threonine/tyrosine-protein kinase catalytic domain-containing protein [Artemisia annua]|uniref:non-specific serine/threonine protein kinase n=1 Tax=Artemisia annua TaxID=35608 RepID=A0A2U1MY45_ARTAN|nr:serine-threonine/tyrosine-protein kinase catalytic domain-containing protein [Artemisia annua]
MFVEVTDVQAQAGFLPQAEKDALIDIAKELGKSDWNFTLNPCDNASNWNWRTEKRSEMPYYNNTLLCNCSYPGGVCHVESLFLKGQDLGGILPPSLAKLPYIKNIDLNRNYLNGTIPREWASTKLEYLSVSVNRLSGRIPAYFGNITSLITVSLESNMFSGTIPAELGKLENLVNLMLHANNLSGELPVELNNLMNLAELRLSSNNFTGKIPSVKSWKRLQKLEMQGSGLEGPIPESVSLLSNLTELRISDLRGKGSHFPNLSSLKRMKTLMLRNCNLNGTIPDYISQMSELKYLDLSFNNLNGDIPNLQGLSSLKKMYLTGNSFNGNVPTWIVGGTDIRSVDLSYNHFSKESVPASCDKSLNLFRSYTGGNDSDLAKCFGNNPCYKDYYSVYINCGGPEATIGNKVYEADQDPGGDTKFFHEPNSWGFSITGSQLDVNKTEYASTNVSILTMNNSELYTRARLSPFSLTYYGRCLVNGNYTVTLHFAEIFFRDNQSYKSLGRRAFDVYIQGVIVFKNFDIRHKAGGVDKAVEIPISKVRVTNKTLEIRLQYAGNGTTAVPVRGVFGPLISAISIESEFKPPTHHKRSIFIVLGPVAVALCLILIVSGIALQRGYLGDRISREEELRGLDLQTGVFTYRQIKAATDNFSVFNKLGEGGFGSVYKGTLLDGTLIAVKQLSSRSKQGNREFVNEIGMIAGIQHPNIVRLHGCCVERNHLLLIYEYMENNSLAHALFENNDSNMEIDWATRQRICVGIAKGLAFLHEESVLKMVHRDIKATNVLLDTKLTPKISDFGLAKLDEEENTHITTRVAGTIGYMAPEYALWGFLTYKADVYSFGVLALEIVAGKSNLKYQPSEDYFCLLDCAAFMERKGSLIDLVDPRLGSNFNKKEAVRMMKIALLCTNQSPALRPTMSEVVSMLEGRTKMKELDDELRFQPLRGKLEDMHSNESDDQPKSSDLPTSSSSHDLYPKSEISEELF